MGSCSFQEHIGVACPGCGIQRSILALLRGEILDSVVLFPALLPLLGMFTFLGIHLVFNLKHGALVLKIFFITNSVLIIGNYLLKFILY